MEWWNRLGRAMTARNLSAKDVAARARVPLKSLYGYLQGDVANPRGDLLRRLAGAVGMSEQELRYGDGFANVTILKRIPLLDMSKIGSLRVNDDPMTQWDQVSLVQVPVEVPEGCWAIIINDESCEPDFPKGSMVICDPNAEILPGKYVIAVLTDDKLAVFGRYRPSGYKDARRFTLIRTNPDYPDIEVGTKVKGFLLARATKHVRDI